MKNYIRALRAPFLSGSLVPVIIGTCYGVVEGHFLFIPFLITLIGVGGLHLGANILNDYYDAKGSDPVNIRLTPFSGGSRVIQDGEVKPIAMLAMSIFFFIIGLAAGIWLAFNDRPLVLLLGALGFFAGWSYSSPPLQLMSRGWGEPVIFFAFGPLVTLGSYYVMAGSLSLGAFALGIPQGFLITGVIWINQFPDYQADKEAGKKNLVVRLGLSLSRYLYCLIMIMSYVSIILLVRPGGFHYLIMLAFISFPLALKAMIITWKKYLLFERLIPAQALTIQTIIGQGILLSISLLVIRLIQ